MFVPPKFGGVWMGIVVLGMTVLLLAVYFIEKRTIWLGGLFLSWLLLATAYLLFSLEAINQQIALLAAVIIAVPFVVLLPFYFVSLIILLMSSGLQLIRREGQQLRHFLSIIFGVFLIVWSMASPFFTFSLSMSPVWMVIYLVITLMVYYVLAALVLFVVSSLLIRIPLPFKSYQYIIVLGSGLIGETVPPLLAARIDKGIQLFQRHHTPRHPVTMIFTGGQGAGESLAEGEAMARYAEEKGVSREHMIVEDQAVNTYENLLFSKQWLEADAEAHPDKKTTKNIVVTNNFHVFRALLWARKVALPSDGAGAKTKFYFWMNALIREFIGVLYMQRFYHLIILLTMTGIIMLFVLVVMLIS